MDPKSFKKAIQQGIPGALPEMPLYNETINHAPKRRDILTNEEKKLAIRNALRYFPAKHHAKLAREFADELKTYGRIYMHRFRPKYKMHARPINEYPHRSTKAAAIMIMIQNNLDEAVAQHPHELITYGGNGAVFQNWAQYLLTMKYLSEMTDEQTLVMYSGHPLGLFPSSGNAPRVVVTNGMMVPNYSKPDDWEKYNALGVTQYGQMTAGSYMYIGSQGIVHGTTITLLNAFRKKMKGAEPGKLLVSSGLGGMSGAQAKAAVIAGAIGVIAEVNPKVVEKRHKQGWVNEVFTDLDKLLERIGKAVKNKEAVSLAYQGNIVTLWEKLAKTANSQKLMANSFIGSDQTSLHNPYSGGYYPVGLSFEQSNKLMVSNPEAFKKKVHESLKRQVNAIRKLTDTGMYFFDYGNAFLLEAGRAGANIFRKDGTFIYPSYIEDIMGPLCFDYGFGPFRWVCTSCNPKDLEITDTIATKALEGLYKSEWIPLGKAPKGKQVSFRAEIKQQLKDNIHWIKEARKNNLVVGSQARILYADCEGRIAIAKAFNKAVREGRLSAPIVIGRDHHDVSGTDSPYRETANIYDGSRFTADMAVQNVIGDAFRGATWVSLHNGGGVGWGEVINGGFGMVLDGSTDSDRNLEAMLFWDVNNGIARRAWARNKGAVFTAKRELKMSKNLQITLPNMVDDRLLDGLV